jgi:hypothetical protein
VALNLPRASCTKSAAPLPHGPRKLLHAALAHPTFCYSSSNTTGGAQPHQRTTGVGSSLFYDSGIRKSRGYSHMCLLIWHVDGLVAEPTIWRQRGRRSDAWTTEEDDYIRANYPTVDKWTMLAAWPRRSWNMIYRRALGLGVHRVTYTFGGHPPMSASKP